MKNIAYIFSCICAGFVFNVSDAHAGGEGNCTRCAIVREYNECHPENNYEFYEDYLKDKEKNEEKTSKVHEKLENPNTSNE